MQIIFKGQVDFFFFFQGNVVDEALLCIDVQVIDYMMSYILQSYWVITVYDASIKMYWLKMKLNDPPL